MTPRPKSAALSRRRLARLAGPVLLGVASTACARQEGPSREDAHGAAGAVGAADLRDPRADLNPEAWPARDAGALREAATQTLTDAPDPKAAGGLADALVQHLAAVHMSPRVLAGRDTDGAIAHLREAAAPLWATPFEDALRGARRPHVATQFASGLEPVGDPWAAPVWSIADGRLHLACTVAHAVLRPEQAQIAAYAVQVRLSVLLEGEEPVRGMDISAILHGADLCATRAAGGLVVPVFDADLQRELREGLLINPSAAPAGGGGIGNRSC